MRFLLLQPVLGTSALCKFTAALNKRCKKAKVDKNICGDHVGYFSRLFSSFHWLINAPSHTEKSLPDYIKMS